MDTADLELFRDTVKRFIREEVAPHYEQWEKAGRVPPEFYLKMGENGLLCVDQPEAYGGIGAPFEFSMVVLEEVAQAGFMALASNLSVHSDIVAPYILHLGTEEQKQDYLPRMASGECIGAIGMTEPGAGSDLANIRSRAVADGQGGWVVNGGKTFITNGQNAGVVCAAIKTDPERGSKGVSLMLLDTDQPGFERGRNLDKIGQHAADTSELFFKDLAVPDGKILGRAGGGFGHMMDELPRERLALAITAAAHARGAIERTLAYVQERKAFGQSVGQFQNTRFILARATAEMESAWAFCEKGMAKYAQGQLTPVDASMIKLVTTELENRVCDQCLQLFGGYGYMSEYPISRDFVDARIQRIYGGTSEIMQEIIARSLLGR
ncbi:MAG: acyl-CoA dehydrogenase family protein [Oceanococcaceae bacterium]